MEQDELILLIKYSMPTENDTQTFQKVTFEDSKFFGVSVRAWLVMGLIYTIIGTHVFVTIGVIVDAIINKDWSKVGAYANIGEPLYGLSMMAIGFYFGKPANKTT